MKKLISFALALVFILSLSTVALAAESNAVFQDAQFGKTFKLGNAGTINPAETFKFRFTPAEVKENDALKVEDMPILKDAVVVFDEGTATTEGLMKNVDVALKHVVWPGVGVYIYNVTEIPGDTAGVSYDNNTLKLKVTVAFDSETQIYYTAFVTMSLADDNTNGTEDGKPDGITDVKTGGFVNTYNAGNLSVHKDVTGNMGDKEKLFDVTVTFHAPTDATVKLPITYVDHEGKEQTLTFNEKGIAVANIKVKDTTTITFKNIPDGVWYTVVESDYSEEGYKTSYTYDTATVNKDFQGAICAEDGVLNHAYVITNNKTTVVDTGIVLDSMPYVLLLAVAFFGMAMMSKKRRYEN